MRLGGQFFFPGLVGCEGGGFAVVDEVVACEADADVVGRWNGGDVEEGVGEGGGVAEIAEE